MANSPQRVRFVRRSPLVPLEGGRSTPGKDRSKRSTAADCNSCCMCALQQIERDWNDPESRLTSTPSRQTWRGGAEAGRSPSSDLMIGPRWWRCKFSVRRAAEISDSTGHVVPSDVPAQPHRNSCYHEALRARIGLPKIAGPVHRTADSRYVRGGLEPRADPGGSARPEDDCQLAVKGAGDLRLAEQLRGGYSHVGGSLVQRHRAARDQAAPRRR